MLILALELRPVGHENPQATRLLECELTDDGATARFRGPVRYPSFGVKLVPVLPGQRPQRMHATVVSTDGDTFVARLTDAEQGE